MRFLLTCFVVLGCLANTCLGQVTELWRTGLTNTAFLCPAGLCQFSYHTNFTTTTAVVDAMGNTFVGGNFTRGGPLNVFVAKFGPQGETLWEYDASADTNPTNNCYNYSGLESLVVDRDGHAYFTTRLQRRGPTVDLSLLLIKLQPDGSEAWRRSEGSVPGNPIATSAVVLDPDDRPMVLGLLWREGEEGQLTTEMAVAKHDADGTLNWWTVLPGGGYTVSGDGLARAMTALPDGGVAVVGRRGDSSFAAKLDTLGRLVWWADGFKGDVQPGIYSSVLPGLNGTICASSTRGATVFSRNGNPIQTEPVFAGQASAVLEDGGFLLNYIQSIHLLGPNGRLRLRVFAGNSGISDLVGVISSRSGGFVASGGSSFVQFGLAFVRYNSKGEVQWRTDIRGYAYIYETYHNLNSFLRAPDGSVRVVLNATARFGPYPSGVTVAAFSLAE